ncbi:MAG: AmmeMemoRadiSam system radical SAM enzyme [Clostridiales bacterium]|nr:AmmeMemoRadiSam system radical SAM enzyme [Clostridiales bacterium]
MKTVICPLCPHHCRLGEGKIGLCRARIGRDGKSQPLGFGQLTSISLDPIEKKPLAHFHPGSNILSVGSFGCNMSCYFCQNEEIAQACQGDVPTRSVSPHALCAQAQALQNQGNIGIAFTYNEPMLNPEYIGDCAAILKPLGLYTVVVTNGCFCLDAVGDLLPQVDAFNIDLKGFTDAWYRRLGGDLDTVKQFIKAAHKVSHVELTTLVVPGENDSEEEIDALAAWVASIDPDIVLHMSRFFPRAKARDKEATNKELLLRLCDVARRHLKHVMPGNI